MPNAKEFLNNPLEGRTVRVSIPASVANDGDLFKSSIKDLLEKLGCRACFSGADCRFTIIRDWVINEKGAASFVNATQQGDPNPNPAFVTSAPATITARLDSSVSRNIDKVFKAIDVIGKNLGCTPCHSGYDIDFRNAIRELRIDEKIQVFEGVGGF